MITEEAREILETLVERARTVIQEWAEDEDRTYIKPESLEWLQKSLAEWDSLEAIEG